MEERGGVGRARLEKTICFDCSKREIFNPSSGLKSLRRKLQQSYKMTTNKDLLTLDRMREASLLFIAGPREKFSQAEFDAMREYLQEGGSIFISLGDKILLHPRTHPRDTHVCCRRRW